MEPIEKSLLSYLEEYAKERPCEALYFTEEKRYPAAVFYAAVLNAAKALEDGGVRKGRNVGLCGTRSVGAVALFFALQALGAVCVMCDPHLPVTENVAASGVDLPLDHVIDFVDGSWLFDGKPFAFSEDEPPRFDLPETDVHAPAMIIFTSGSTGKNKGVILSQYNLVNHQRNFHAVGGNEDGDSAIQMLPIFHIFGVTQIIDGVMHCCPIFFPREVTPAYICACVKKYRFTRFGFVPSFALAMAYEKQKNGYDTDSLKIAVLAGAPSTREQFSFIEETLGMKIVPVYGMSELPGISGAGPDESADDRAGSVGRILPMTEVCFTSEGEIAVRGPALFLGYVGEEPTDQSAFFRTGDLGMLDEKGFLHITGRLKDVIIRNGNNLSAAALTEKILSLPFVADAAVVGIKDEKCGEVPAAALVLKEGQVYDEAAFRARFNKQELPAKVLILPHLPLNAAGKTDKTKIRELFT